MYWGSIYCLRGLFVNLALFKENIPWIYDHILYDYTLLITHYTVFLSRYTYINRTACTKTNIVCMYLNIALYIIQINTVLHFSKLHNFAWVTNRCAKFLPFHSFKKLAVFKNIYIFVNIPVWKTLLQIWIIFSLETDTKHLFHAH